MSSRKKLTDRQKLAIALNYAFSDCYTMEMFAIAYDVSIKTISKSLHEAIETGIVSRKTALQIRDKAVFNVKLHYRSTVNVRKSFSASIAALDKLIHEYEIEFDFLKKQLNSLTYKIEHYDEVFNFSEDEPSKELIQKKLENTQADLDNTRQRLYRLTSKLY